MSELYNVISHVLRLILRIKFSDSSAAFRLRGVTTLTSMLSEIFLIESEGSSLMETIGANGVMGVLGVEAVVNEKPETDGVIGGSIETGSTCCLVD